MNEARPFVNIQDEIRNKLIRSDYYKENPGNLNQVFDQLKKGGQKIGRNETADPDGRPQQVWRYLKNRNKVLERSYKKDGPGGIDNPTFYKYYVPDDIINTLTKLTQSAHRKGLTLDGFIDAFENARDEDSVKFRNTVWRPEREKWWEKWLKYIS